MSTTDGRVRPGAGDGVITEQWIDCVMIRACYGLVDPDHERGSWSVCGSRELPNIYYKPGAAITTQDGRHTHSGKALIMVRVSRINGEPLVSYVVLATASILERDSVRGQGASLPDMAGLTRCLDAWATRVYGTPAAGETDTYTVPSLGT